MLLAAIMSLELSQLNGGDENQSSDAMPGEMPTTMLPELVRHGRTSEHRGPTREAAHNDFKRAAKHTTVRD